MPTGRSRGARLRPSRRAGGQARQVPNPANGVAEATRAREAEAKQPAGSSVEARFENWRRGRDLNSRLASDR
jgi:hypothetical protein